MRKIELHQKATQALLSIVLFIIVYLILIFAALALGAACIYAGIFIVTHKISFLTLLITVGLLAIGLLVPYFLVKFIFKRYQVDRSGMTLITETDQPKLFALVRELVGEVGTHFPKNIYLSPDVNASVFYDSSFWSMFLPIRKNLVIGLGLINSTTEGELKAILAHEFGHFSQRSMKIGSYVYNVNRILHNLLYDNQSYANTVSVLAQAHEVLAIFASIGVKIVVAFQWILGKMYQIVNLQYMKLSREMEFEADEIAASVAGSKPLIDSLVRLELSSHAYDKVIEYYNGEIKSNIKPSNIYPQHSLVMNSTAQINSIPVVNGLPRIQQEKAELFVKSLLVITDQWASHPTIEERVNRLAQLNVSHEASEAPAWTIFERSDLVQKSVTAKLFHGVVYAEEPKDQPFEIFAERQDLLSRRYDLPRLYQDFYETRAIHRFHPTAFGQTVAASIDDIFNLDTTEMVKRQRGMERDLSLLQQLSQPGISIKTFDYDGKKYKVSEAADLRKELEKEKEELDRRIDAIDVKAWSYFRAQAASSQRSEELDQAYRQYFDRLTAFEEDKKLYEDLAEGMQFIYESKPYNMIVDGFEQIGPMENRMKHKLTEWLTEPGVREWLGEKRWNDAREFVGQSWTYFLDDHYIENSLALLLNGVTVFGELVYDRFFRAKKELLAYQATLINKAVVSV